MSPQTFSGLSGEPIVDFSNEVFTFRLGAGRKISENLSIFAQAGFEKSNGGVSSRLSPTDGRRSIGVGARYTSGAATFSGGIEYVKLGDAIDGSGVEFEGNDGLGFGVSVGFEI